MSRPVFSGFSALWCITAALAAALNSRQIYGLRERIREFGKLGQYTLEEKIGEGGMGVVYRARHALLRRPTAVKLLPRAKVGADARGRGPAQGRGSGEVGSFTEEDGPAGLGRRGRAIQRRQGLVLLGSAARAR